jgi:hypothetical protein
VQLAKANTKRDADRARIEFFHKRPPIIRIVIYSYNISAFVKYVLLFIQVIVLLSRKELVAKFSLETNYKD